MGPAMTTWNRIGKLLEQARMLAKDRQRAVRRRQCQNATWEELLRLFKQSIAPESLPVVKDIFQQIKDYDKRPPEECPRGTFTKSPHGFIEWLQGLREGWAALPETIPHVVLLAWRNDYARRKEEAQRLLPY